MNAKVQPWSGDPDPDWVARVDGWGWVQAAEWEWRKHGPCPHCGHLMTIRIEATEAVFGQRLRPLRAWCNCPIEHPGNPLPEGQRRGCGQQGTIQPPPVQDSQR